MPNTERNDTSNSYSNAGHKTTLESESFSFKHQMTASYSNGEKEVQHFELTPPAAERILIVDDDRDTTLTFKKAFEAENENRNSKISFTVSTYNDPLIALSEFKPDFYHLLLIDINMPKMNGFEFFVEVLEIDVNPRVCYMSSGLINQVLREQYPSLSIGCFIKKPVTMEYLVRKVRAELE